MIYLEDADTYIDDIKRLAAVNEWWDEIYKRLEPVKAMPNIKLLTDQDRAQVDAHAGPERTEWRPIRADWMSGI